jgi:CRP/FNR family nitrogen fixation transcriptional regulator
MLATSQAIDPRSGVTMTYPIGAFPAAGRMPKLASGQAGAARAQILAALEPRATTVRFERDDEIMAQEAPAAWCYLVISGCVRTVRLMEDGRRQVGEFLFAGDLFGCEALETHDFGAEAVTPVTLRRYARRDLERLADQDRDVARGLRELSSSRLRSGREHMLLLGRKTASERIASFLLEMAARSSADAKPTIELPMSRSDMGDYLGLTIETVCRRLTRLRLDGTIAIHGTKVAIRNRIALGEAGCERLHRSAPEIASATAVDDTSVGSVAERADSAQVANMDGGRKTRNLMDQRNSAIRGASHFDLNQCVTLHLTYAFAG